MSILRTLIIDDEPLAHKVLEGYCSKIESISIVGNCYDGISALQFLKANEVELLLLDIQMPDITGLELLDGLKQQTPKVIFITAFTEYAIDGFNYDQVVDYLHKPIRISRFIKSIERVQNILSLEEEFQNQADKKLEEESASIFEKCIVLKENKNAHKIPFSEIEYIQSWGNYLKFFLSSQKVIIVRKTLKELAGELPVNLFQRIHKSYIVNVKQVTSIEGNIIKLKDAQLTVGKNYSELIKKKFQT